MASQHTLNHKTIMNSKYVKYKIQNIVLWNICDYLPQPDFSEKIAFAFNFLVKI